MEIVINNNNLIPQVSDHREKIEYEEWSYWQGGKGKNKVELFEKQSGFLQSQNTIWGKGNIEKWSKGSVNSTQEKKKLQTSGRHLWKPYDDVIEVEKRLKRTEDTKRKRNEKNLRDQLMSWRIRLRDNRKITSEKSKTIVIQSLRKVVDEMKIKI